MTTSHTRYHLRAVGTVVSRSTAFLAAAAVSLFVVPDWTEATSFQKPINDLKMIGLCLAQYANDHGELLPPMTNAESVRKALAEYAGNDKIFYHPTSGEPYQPNPKMTGRRWQDDAEAVLFFEASANSDGGRAVLFNDGHAEYISAERWKELCRQQGIPPTGADDQAAKLDNLRKLGAGLLLYVHDGNKTLPPFHDMAATKSALLPYTDMKDVFVHLDSREPYRPNLSLSGKKFSAIPSPGGIVVFYESTPTNETRGVLFLDGRVKRVAESKWLELKKASGIQ